MGHTDAILALISALVGIAIGYALGFFTGRFFGELRAIKRGRHESRRSRSGGHREGFTDRLPDEV